MRYFVLLLVVLIIIGGCSFQKSYSPLQGGHLDLRAEWAGTNTKCEGYNAPDDINTYLIVTYPTDAPVDSRKVNCKYEIDDQVIQRYQDIAEKDVPIVRQSQTAQHTIKVCCYGQWEKDKTYGACTTGQIDKKC